MATRKELGDISVGLTTFITVCGLCVGLLGFISGSQTQAARFSTKLEALETRLLASIRRRNEQVFQRIETSDQKFADAVLESKKERNKIDERLDDFANAFSRLEGRLEGVGKSGSKQQ